MKSKKKLNILLTNDDGIFFEGLTALYNAFKEDYNIFVVAPEQEQSGSSHKITISHPLKPKKINKFGIKGIKVDGTTADCVKIALQNFYKDKIDLVLSGINKGSNNGISIHYSGTVSAVIEGAFYKVPGIAVSLFNYEDKKFEEAAHYLKGFLKENIASIIERKSLLNINIPENADFNRPPKFCRMGLGNFNVDYVKYEYLGNHYYWCGGPEKNVDLTREDDDRFILENEITITPLKIDLTDYEEMKFWLNKKD